MSVPENTLYYLEIVTPDPEAARKLYAETHGWSFEGPIPELGNAYLATLPDGSQCGIRAPMHDQEDPVVRPYIRVADLEKAVGDAVRMGATIMLDRMELPGRGVIAIYGHGGVQQGLWQLP